jgi:homoserine kinase type II
MSVYTPLSLDEVQQFSEAYGLEVVELIPIQGGFKTPTILLSPKIRNSLC